MLLISPLRAQLLRATVRSGIRLQSSSAAAASVNASHGGPSASQGYSFGEWDVDSLRNFKGYVHIVSYLPLNTLGKKCVPVEVSYRGPSCCFDPQS